jgi:hypothetical protein
LGFWRFGASLLSSLPQHLIIAATNESFFVADNAWLVETFVNALQISQYLSQKLP